MLGSFLKAAINTWVGTSGRLCRYDDYPWLKGPVGSDRIGDDFYTRYAEKEGLEIRRLPDGGLLRDFRAAILAADPLRDRVLPEIAHFYEHTAAYKLEVWSQWYRPYSFFARTLIKTLSGKMDQLNIPLYPLETSRGMSNEVLHLVDPASGAIMHACWLRKSILSGNVVYSGFYSRCTIGEKEFVRVIFPLPKGSATVLLRVEALEDGSVMLVSKGKGIGDAGYYRVQESGPGRVRVKYIPLKETIHVFRDEDGVLRTDHIFRFLNRKLLHLHYKILPKANVEF